jgi:hypothetical protein
MNTPSVVRAGYLRIGAGGSELQLFWTDAPLRGDIAVGATPNESVGVIHHVNTPKRSLTPMTESHRAIGLIPGPIPQSPSRKRWSSLR